MTSKKRVGKNLVPVLKDIANSSKIFIFMKSLGKFRQKEKEKT